MDKGVVVDIGNDIEGFRADEPAGPSRTFTQPADAVKIGQVVELKVLEWTRSITASCSPP